MKIVTIISLLVLGLVGCNRVKKATKAPPTQEQVKVLLCGDYKGNYNHGTEYFSVREDGSFSQKFVQNGTNVYELQGKWSFRKLNDRYMVEFGPFMNLEDSIISGKPPEKIFARIATFYDDEPAIYFFRDINYFITK